MTGESVQCESCAMPHGVPGRRVFLVDPETALEAAERVGMVQCGNCGSWQNPPLPILYIDPTHKDVIFVVDDDRAGLMDEYHQFVDDVASELSDDALRLAREGHYQILLDVEDLRALVAAERDNTYIYRWVPGMEEPDFSSNSFLEVAAVYRNNGRIDYAFDLLQRAAEFLTSRADFFRELAAYAIANGQGDLGQEMLAKSDELATQFRHLPLQGGPSVGVISKAARMPPTLETEVRSMLEGRRPELRRSETTTARLAGLLVGELERAIVAFEDSDNLSLFRSTALSRFERWLAEDERSTPRQSLKEIFDRNRAEPMQGLPFQAHPEMLLRHARLFLGTDREPAALEELRRLCHDDANPAVRDEAAYVLGSSLLKTNPSEAQDLFERAAESRFVRIVADASLRLGHLALEQSDFESARGHLSVSAELGDRSTAGWSVLLLAAMAREDGDLEEERRLLTSLIDEDLGDVTAQAAMRLGDLELITAAELLRLGDRGTDFELRTLSWFKVALVMLALGDQIEAQRLFGQLDAMPIVGETIRSIARRFLSEDEPGGGAGR